MTAIEVLEGEEGLSNFARALGVSGAGDMLERKGPYTVFAPTDDIFNINTIGGLIGSARLEDLLFHFIVPGKYMSDDLRRLQFLKTVGGHSVVISSGDGILVNGESIIKPDMPYNKGVIHEIGKKPGAGCGPMS